MIDTGGKFYIGRTHDLKQGKTLDSPILYDPADLTTHGVVVGMTGSGKTGLCIDLLEEAALQGIPALLVDPKGDLANLLLHFPDLSPESFAPWVDPDDARREGKSVEQAAADTAALWRTGLADWGIEPARIAQVREAVEYAVYTPGSESGIPVNIVGSLAAPEGDWESDRERFRELIASTATALLGLVDIEADPVQSREHILLSNLLEHAWKAGQDVDLTELIRQIQTPPFEKLGAFEIEQFYASGDRFELAMRFNNLLASPAFQAWTTGTPLDVGAMLWTPEGRPRHSVFYLAHLSDSERMFFVTLLLASLEAWMRSQSGSSTLRALFYMDEVFGYLPPTAAPPSKAPMLRLLKQARAFGLGLLLATQNPVDLDYKALSNAGTWFVGKLQTEQDKARLLDGLEGAASGSGFDRRQVDDILSSIGKRVFLLHNVHEKAPVVFYTRWAMAYLRGPITRTRLEDLNALAGAAAPAGAPAAAATEAAEPAAQMQAVDLTQTRPAVPSGVTEYFLPPRKRPGEALEAAGRTPQPGQSRSLVYRPALAAQATVRFLDRKAGIDDEETVTALDLSPDRRGVVRWDSVAADPIEVDRLDSMPEDEAAFGLLQAPLSDSKAMKSLEKDFADYVYRGVELRLLSNDKLKLVAAPGMSEEDFRQQCMEAADEAADEEAEKLKAKFETKIKRIQDKLAREERELAEDQAEHSARRMEEVATHAENLLGLFGSSRSRRRVSSSLTKRRMTSRAKAEIEESMDAIADFKEELEELEDEMAEALEDLDARWDEIAEDLEDKVLTPRRQDVHVELFGVAWVPHWRIAEGERTEEVTAY